MYFFTGPDQNCYRHLEKKSKSLYEISLISLHCGLRAGEIFSLKYAEIDLTNNHLILTETKAGKNRFIPMTKQVRNILSSKTGVKNDLVFPDRNGEKRKAISDAFTRTVNDLKLNAGINDRRNKIVFHSLRHTFASILVQQGVSIYEVSKLLGHSTITMTERYSHLSPSNFKNSVRIIEKMHSSNKNGKLIELKTKSS